jgi:hypothetical protein
MRFHRSKNGRICIAVYLGRGYWHYLRRPEPIVASPCVVHSYFSPEDLSEGRVVP